MRAAAYVRISRDREGQALGVARQERDARELAARRGWEVVAVYSDNDVAASGKRQRPGWDAMLKAMREGEVEAVVAYSASRLYRNLRDLSAFLELVEQRAIAVATVVSGDVRVDTADGRMLARILASIDQGEWERARERVMRKRQELTADGRWTGGHVGFGYRVEDGRLVVDEAEAAIIRDAARRLLSGESQGSIVRRWAAEGVRTRQRGRPWSLQTFGDLMRRDLPGILAEVDTERLRSLYASRRTGPRREGRHLLTGLLTCGRCGRRMVHRGARYVCLGDDPARSRVEQGVVGEPLERHVVREAGLRHVPRPASLVDVHAPLYAERLRIVAEQDALADSALPVRMIERRGLRLQRELERVDDELRALPVDAAANSAQWGYALDWPFDMAGDPELRAWLMTLVEDVTVSPATRGTNRFDPTRVAITWRRGVELSRDSA